MSTIAKASMPVVCGYDIGELVDCPCSFATNGTSAIDATSIKGDILVSVDYAATGVYTLTLADVGYTIVTAIPHLQQNTATTDAEAALGAIDESAKTVVIQIRKSSDATALAPPAANANNRVHLNLKMSRKSISRHRS